MPTPLISYFGRCMQHPCGFTFWLARFLLSDFSVFIREGFRVTGQGLSALPDHYGLISLQIIRQYFIIE
jgi:hypothetical protein